VVTAVVDDITDEDGSAGSDGPPVVPDEGRGPGLIRLSWFGTGLYLLVALVATVRPGTAQLALIIVCVALFLAGTGAFAVAYLIAIGRSREEAIGMGGLFFLAGSAPARVRRHLLGSFAVETVVALVSASVGLAATSTGADNPLAFGVLTPLYGLGLAGNRARTGAPARAGWPAGQRGRANVAPNRPLAASAPGGAACGSNRRPRGSGRHLAARPAPSSEFRDA
jgi:hypothetical protein